VHVTGLVRSLLALPGRFARAAWHFIDPPLKVGRVPFARTVLVMQIVAALVFLGYTLVKKGVRMPFSPEPYLVDVMLPDAKGLNPTKEPAVGVAGVNVGKVVAAEYTEGGQARVTLRLDPEMRDKVFADATAFVRPTSVLQTLIVNINPGDPATGPLPEGEPIDAADTGAFVHIDELTGVLDADTQAQVQVLISEAATALKGREPELRAILSQLGHLTDGATPLAKALAQRRALVSRLTSNLDTLFTTLGQRGTQLAHAIYAGRHTLDVTAAREPELAEATRELGPTLREATGALRATRGLTTELEPALDELVPVADSVPPAAAKLRELAPTLDDFITLADGVVDDGRKPARLLAGGLKGLSNRVKNDQVPALEELVDLVNLLFEYRFGLVQFAENFSGVVSGNRVAGPYANFAILNAEVTANGFGLPARAAESRNGEPSRLNRLLAESLEHVCKDTNPIACVARVGLPELPEEPILGDAKSGGGE
jgi:phospholipid/cholesterol/gamma-HCH transport system substrate-binding protein